jgi:hypothetical protein
MVCLIILQVTMKVFKPYTLFFIMKLSDYDKKYLLNVLPKIKRSYVKNNHKKVSTADIYIIIPKGKKYFTWFRYYKNAPCCIILELGNRGVFINNIYIKYSCFNDTLCYGCGTILYGTMFNKNKNELFSVEDILYYRGRNLYDRDQVNKFSIIRDMFKTEIKQINFHNTLIFGLPIIKNNRAELTEYLLNPPYEIYCIQHRYFKNNIYYNEKRDIQKTAVFLVEADITDDIYSLYRLGQINSSNKYEYSSTALIPDYKTSVMMNALFRNIKENINLDYLEESDDESDFENTRSDKYLKNIKYKMVCKYNNKYKLWSPIKVTDARVCSENDIINVEKIN